MTTRRSQLAALALLALAAAPARASFHDIKIVQVFPGSVLQPNAQYVVLQAWIAGQNFVAGQPLKFYDRNNNLVGTAAFGGNVLDGADQMTLLVATASATTLFNVTADLVMANPNVLAAGGKICWDVSLFGVIDCVAWGDHPGSAGTAALGDVGTPFSKAYGLVPGVAMIRRLDISGSAAMLEDADDTNNCRNDFVAGVPAPRNNAGQAGTVPPSTCGNDTVEGLESCDDGGTQGGDGCSATCQFDDGVFRDQFEGF
jgi:cysteine-rich repeat protein